MMSIRLRWPVWLLASIVLPWSAVAQSNWGGPFDSSYPAPWGARSGAEITGEFIRFSYSSWSADVDATTTTDRWDTVLSLTQEGIEGVSRSAEDIILEGADANAFEIRENTCVGETAPGQSCGVRIGLREGVADGTYTVFVRDAVSGRSARVTVRLERPRDIDLTISGTVYNYDVGAAAVAAGWVSGMGVNLNILPGALVGSAGTWAPALRIGGFPGSVRQVTVINHGRIQGAGGQGGQGAGSEGARRGIWWQRAQDGGPAMRVDVFTTIENHGQIWGGGGGGGSGHCRRIYYSAGSGGGGAGSVPGAGGRHTGERFSAFGPGSPGTTESGGNGSCSQLQSGWICPSGGSLEIGYCDPDTSWACPVYTGRCQVTIGPGQYSYYNATPTYERCGGRGGGPGEPGQPGTGGESFCGGNEPGQPGPAVDGSDLVMWRVLGDVRGPLRR